MKTGIKTLTTFTLIFMCFSCSEVKKQVAIDDLKGKFFGSPKVIFQWSKLNIGIDDENAGGGEKETIVIWKDSQDNLTLNLGDGIILRLNNISMANNGAAFNIPTQDIKLMYAGKQYGGNISGLNECFVGENRCDGFYNNETHKLSLSFSGTINISQDGILYNVPIAVGYSDYSKISL